MKKLISFALAILVLLCAALPASAADGKVTYDGNAKKFVFQPGTEHSLTDLFPNFKDVMPGDSLTQKIAVVNEAKNNVKVKIYLRALGAHADSVDFLSQLGLRVKKSTDNDMSYMFQAAADQKAQLSDWVCLGTLYSGGEVNLDVILDVPVELDNQYSQQIGYLDWEFKIEEYPVDSSDPAPPHTGDDTNMMLWYILACCSAVIMCIILIWHRKNKKDKDEEQQVTRD